MRREHPKRSGALLMLALATSIARMQDVLTPVLPQAPSPGSWVIDPRGAPHRMGVQVHVLAPGHTLTWPASDAGSLWVPTERLGKAIHDGAAQRIAVPCVLRQLAGTGLRFTTQGSMSMPAMRWAPLAHDPPYAVRSPEREHCRNM